MNYDEFYVDVEAAVGHAMNRLRDPTPKEFDELMEIAMSAAKEVAQLRSLLEGITSDGDGTYWCECKSYSVYDCKYCSARNFLGMHYGTKHTPSKKTWNHGPACICIYCTAKREKQVKRTR